MLLPLETDQWIGVAFGLTGLAILVWGARELDRARRRPSGQGAMGRALAGGARLWTRLTAAGLLVSGAMCLLAGLYLLLNLRNL